MKQLIYASFLSMLFMLSGPIAYGTHIMGGEMTYQHVNGDTFEVMLSLYRDCSPGSATLGNSVSLTVTSPGCTTMTISAYLVPGSAIDITPMCSSFPSPCSGSGGSGLPLGVEYYAYTATVAIPCNDFRISWSSCCRNSDISNGLADATFSIYVDNLSPGITVIGPNSSPVFTNPATIFAPVGQPVSFDFSAIDTDGDSLVYRLGQPEGTIGNPLPYAPGYNPLSAPVYLDSITGILTTQVNTAEIDVIRIDVDEYRKTTNGWQHIGSIFRDIQLIFTNSTNLMPTISGIDSTSQDTWYAMMGDTVSFSIYTHDQNPFDSVSIAGYPSSGGQFTTLLGMHEAGSFVWVTDSTHISAQPHVLIIEARDNGCPANGLAYKAIKIFVTNSDTSEVWPGDADNDLIANHYDILPIGVAYGASGPARANASTNWVGQPAQNWPQQFATGLNYKFADCNGDGTIDTADVNVVNQNFGLTHNRYNPYARQPASADLWIEIDEDTLQPGDQVTAKLFFGDAQNTLTAYGVAFSLIIDPGIIDATSLDMQFEPNWLAPGGLEFKKQDGNGNLHAALVRTNGQNAHGGGTIAELTFTIRPDANITPGTQLPLSFVDVLAIDASEASLNITSGVDEAILDKSTGIARPTFALEITPNPADDQIRITGLVDWDAIEVFNKLGQRVPVVLEHTGNHVLLNTTGLKPGFYIISVQSGDVVKSTSALIQR